MLSIGLLFLDRTRCKYHSSIRRECRQVRGTSSWDQHHNCAYEEDDVWILLHRNRLPIFIPSPHACAGCTWSFMAAGELNLKTTVERLSKDKCLSTARSRLGGVSWRNFLRPTVVNKAGGAADQSGPFSNFWSVENGTYFCFLQSKGRRWAVVLPAVPPGLWRCISSHRASLFFLLNWCISCLWTKHCIYWGTKKGLLYRFLLSFFLDTRWLVAQEALIKCDAITVWIGLL